MASNFTLTNAAGEQVPFLDGCNGHPSPGPIYGDRDVNGRQIKASQLDRCNGIKSPTPEFPQGIYHCVALRSRR